MASIRVTQGLLVRRTIDNLNNHLRKLARLQNQLATGLRVNSPSEDPIAVRRAVNTRTNMQKNDQYLANIQSVQPQLNETGSSIQAALEALQRSKELALQGANGANSQQQLDAIAIELNQLLEELVVQSNHQTNGRYLFGGTRTMNPPFVTTRNAGGDITAVTFDGNTESIEVAISDGITVDGNVPGTDVFMSQEDLFQVLIDVRDNLRAGNQTVIQEQLLGNLDRGMGQLLTSMARVGSVQNRLDRSAVEIQEFDVQLKTLLSDTIDADYAETMISLNAESNAFEAALNAGSRVIQPSLLDFIR